MNLSSKMQVVLDIKYAGHGERIPLTPRGSMRLGAVLQAMGKEALEQENEIALKRSPTGGST